MDRDQWSEEKRKNDGEREEPRGGGEERTGNVSKVGVIKSESEYRKLYRQLLAPPQKTH